MSGFVCFRGCVAPSERKSRERHMYVAVLRSGFFLPPEDRVCVMAGGPYELQMVFLSWAESKPVSGTEPPPVGKNDWSIHVGDTVIV